MGQHASFSKGLGAMSKKRNVLKRFERVALLKAEERWKPGDSVCGLPKTKPMV